MAHSNGFSLHSQNQHASLQLGLFTHWRVMLLHSHLLGKTTRRFLLYRNKYIRADFNNCVISLFVSGEMFYRGLRAELGYNAQPTILIHILGPRDT